MWKRLLPLILLIPCWAQIQKNDFLRMLETQSEAELAQAVAGDCIGFPVDRETLAAFRDREQVLLAILECLYRRNYPNTGVVSFRATPPSKEAPAQSTPTPASNPAPPPVAAVLEPPRLSIAVSTDTLVRKIVESIRTLQVAQSLEDKAERVRVQTGTKSFLVHILAENGTRLSSSSIEEALPAGESLPDWIEVALQQAREAGERGFPRLDFEVRSGTDFSGTIDENGIRVYMGMYLVDRHPGEIEPYNLEDRLLMAHAAFPVSYNPETDEFDLTRLKGTGVTRMRLNKGLNKMKPLEMVAGKWIVRIFSTTGRGSIRSDSSHSFELAPGKNYTMGIRWQSDRGVKTLRFNLMER